MVIVPHQLVGIPLMYNASLECIVEAHPTSLNYWCRENEKMIYDSQKYKYVRLFMVLFYTTLIFHKLLPLFSLGTLRPS